MSRYSLADTTWDDAEYHALSRVIASGRFVMGENVVRFERDFSDWVGARHCVMVSSGSAANLLMVAALFYRKKGRLARGDEVIVPAVSWSTTYSPLYQYGLTLKFVDIDANTLNYDLSALATAVTDKTRLIVAVNLLGNPNDFARIREIISGRDIVLIEDNCESMGAIYRERQAGTFGLMGSFSSFFSHHISTMEGGMIVTDDEELYHILLSLRAHGWTRNLPKHNHVCGPKSEDTFVELYRFVLPGYNVRPTELNAAVGIEQLKKLPRFIQVRRDNARMFKTLISDFPYLRMQREIGKSSWFGFSLVVGPDAPYRRADLIQTMETYQIECRPIVTGNFTKNEVIKWFDYTIHGELRNAEDIDLNGFFVGNHHYPLDAQFELLGRALHSLERERELTLPPKSMPV